MSSSSPPSDVKTEMSHSGGVKPMTISGRTVLEKQRLEGMTVEEREWRKKWLKDQVLTPREPILIPTDSPDLMNPIRRFYRKPLDVLFFKILPFKQVHEGIGTIGAIESTMEKRALSCKLNRHEISRFQEDKLIAQGLRYYTGKILMGIGILYMGFYYFKYNTRVSNVYGTVQF